MDELCYRILERHPFVEIHVILLLLLMKIKLKECQQVLESSSHLLPGAQQTPAQYVFHNIDGIDNRRGYFRNRCHRAVKENCIQGNSAACICSRKNVKLSSGWPRSSQSRGKMDMVIRPVSFFFKASNGIATR